MKTLSFILALMLTTSALAQEEGPVVPVNAEGMIMYRAVVEQPGPADSLYLRSIGWLNSEFSNPWDVSRERRREDGILSGTARMTLMGTNTDGSSKQLGLVEYTFTIESKDGRYRYTFTDFLLKQTSRFPLERWLDTKDPLYTEAAKGQLRQVNEHILARIESLKKGMQPKPKVLDEW
ncbi:MAG TPA: DUF4468 domain-containing protein [Bacteroidales bacterium]|nr:DUF4468 domain-containing protein [Bacteroidales bacterium]HRZ77628.1 DUF4468 domain-containing protein [Bacteroidales bacterium]